MSHVIGFICGWFSLQSVTLPFYIRDNRSYWALELWILHFTDNIGMYWLYLWLLIYLNLVNVISCVICIVDKMQYLVIGLFSFVLGKIQNDSRLTLILNINNNL